MRPELHAECDECAGPCMACSYCGVLMLPDQVEYLPAPADREPEPVCPECAAVA